MSSPFAPVVIGGGSIIPEVGFGQEGFGIGGFDAPTIILPAASTPVWTVVVVR